MKDYQRDNIEMHDGIGFHDPHYPATWTLHANCLQEIYQLTRHASELLTRLRDGQETVGPKEGYAEDVPTGVAYHAAVFSLQESANELAKMITAKGDTAE